MELIDGTDSSGFCHLNLANRHILARHGDHICWQITQGYHISVFIDTTWGIRLDNWLLQAPVDEHLTSEDTGQREISKMQHMNQVVETPDSKLLLDLLGVSVVIWNWNMDHEMDDHPCRAIHQCCLLFPGGIQPTR
jgi:hypothetical protein